MIYAAAAQQGAAPVTQSTPLQGITMQPMIMSPAPSGNNFPQGGTSLTPAGSTVSVLGTSPGVGPTLVGTSNLSKSTPDLHAAGEKDTTTSREQTRQISLLLAELDAARDLNKKVFIQLLMSRVFTQPPLFFSERPPYSTSKIRLWVSTGSSMLEYKYWPRSRLWSWVQFFLPFSLYSGTSTVLSPCTQ